MAETIYFRPQPAARQAPPVFDMLKRLFDLTVSALAIVLLAPVYLYLAYRIRRDSPGPVLYFGPRLGKDGQVFQIRKFRTMREEPESYAGPRVTAHDDPRITPLGKWLRDTKLNELPQLWNVLVGEMSLVGPRPEDPEIAAGWSPELRQEVLSVRPGITSPASVLFRDEESLLKSGQVMSTYFQDILPSKLRLDQLYVRHRSFLLDLDTLFWTALVLLPLLGKYKPPEVMLFLGPVNRLARRYLNWFVVDAVICMLAMSISGLAWRAFGPLDLGWGRAVALAFGFACLYSVVGALLGVNKIAWSRAGAFESYDLLPAAVAASLVILAVNAILPDLKPDDAIRSAFPMGMILMGSALAFVGFVSVRYRSRLVTAAASRWLARRGGLATGERVLIIGGGETGQFAAFLLANNHNQDAFRIVGYVDDDLYKQDVRIRGVNVLGQTTDIPQLVAKHDIGILVFAIHNITAADRRRLLEICAATPARTIFFPDVPAALHHIVLENNKNGKSSPTNGGHAPEVRSPQFAARKSPLPCHLCLAKLSPLKVDAWLAGLEQAAQGGDLASVQAQLTSLRANLRPDTQTQLDANLDNEQ